RSLNFILPQFETYLPPLHTPCFSTRTIRAYCRCDIYKILKPRGTHLANDDYAAGLSIYLCG
ncbi:hypothetical protein, partial [uncultured Campylobacter sp.]|uniref:hypothetical protein n=1 Tax=uncultured Campylobacter sp. TaxID=218934 RepID=UPI00262529D0